MQPGILYTIGHSTRPWDDFVDLLRELDLLRRGEEGVLPDVGEVAADEIVRPPCPPMTAALGSGHP